uniref:uncharacterized protein LOC120949562 n=1 Tax=Anopheles coluzzii TaxID=1518534 RepID=UPI0020FFABBF|nr:uncharacterized protein LOC120949562 [Anopheles coluzzii]XP_049462985.1 uncharacterized protein LOC120949562 [Anopheles coluzzii]
MGQSLKGNPRFRAYPASYNGIHDVFFMPKNKQLDVRAITASVYKKYPGVLDIIRPRPNKLRVTAKDRMQANAIAADPSYTEDYRVHIPGGLVEVVGVIDDLDYPLEDILKYGQGAFLHQSSPRVKVLEVKKLYASSAVDGKKVFRETSSLRITFEGTVLPNTLYIEGFRVPIRRPFVQKIACCTKCRQIGHSEPYCTNSVKCGKCKGSHSTSECKAETQKCIHCKQEWHEMSLCSVYRKKQSEHKRAVLQNTRGLYADVLKSTSSVNPFDNLSLLEGNEPLPNMASLIGVKRLHTTRVPNKKTIKKKY